MKRMVGIILLVSLLTDCGGKSTQLDRAMDLRKKLLETQVCQFDTTVTADYGDSVHTFQLSCQADSTGKLTFTVISPESISGITGTIEDSGASLTFDDTVIAFPLLADGQLSPVGAPWVFLKTLRGGYLAGCGENDDGLVISMDDTYGENPLHLEIYTDNETIPIGAEVYWQQQCILTMQIRNFHIQ